MNGANKEKETRATTHFVPGFVLCASFFCSFAMEQNEARKEQRKKAKKHKTNKRKKKQNKINE